LLVVDNTHDINKPIGIVTPRDLIKYSEFTRDDANKDYLEKILEYFI
jgi:CBS domain containing-hemolysin-like protein